MGPTAAVAAATVIGVARKDTVLVYDPDPRWYVTAEVDPGPPVRRWYRLWWDAIAERHTGSQDPDELVAMIEAVGLDPEAWREPTVEEKQPRRDT
jgi:hypothetical protein